jgi:DNA helicase HerA-like ATPase
MQDFEKLGAFYLGRTYDLAAGKRQQDMVLYDSKDLVTHGVCVGMTGSGKTGLCLSILEEAAIDGVPVIAVDPKGDLGNLLLTFPNLCPEDSALGERGRCPAERRGAEAFAADQAAK